MIGSSVFWFYNELLIAPYGWKAMYFVLVAVFVIGVAVIFAGLYTARLKSVTPDYGHFFLSCGLFWLLVGVLAWFPEEINHSCVGTPLQLHAIWHAGVALALWSSFVYFRSTGNQLIHQMGLLNHVLLWRP
jgi:hypothetical protein